MSTVQVIIESRFNNSGVMAAEAALNQVFGKFGKQIQGIKDLRLSDEELDVFNKLDPDKVGKGIDNMINAVNHLGDEYRALGSAAADAGKGQKALQFERAAASADNLAGRLKNLKGRTENVSSSFTIAQHNLAKFAFALFVAQGTIGTITSSLSKLWGVLQDGANALDRMNASTQLFSQMGVNVGALKDQLAAASQGAMTMDQSLRPTLALMKAGLPDIAQSADELLKIATNAAIVSGEVDQAGKIYEKLVKGIIKGSPQLIDDADIILRLESAYKAYAASINKTTEELSEADRKRAAFFAVMEEGARINELAEGLDSTSLALQQVKTDWAEAALVLKTEVAEALAEVIIDMREARKASQLFITVFDDNDMNRTLQEAFEAQPVRTFTVALITGAKVVASSFMWMVDEAKEWAQLKSKMFDFVGQSFSNLMSVLSGDMTAAEAHQAASEMFMDIGDTVATTIDPLNNFEAEIEDVEQAVIDGREALGMLEEGFDGVGGAAEASADDLAEAAKAAEEAAAKAQQEALRGRLDQLSSSMEAAMKARTGIDAQYGKKRADIEESTADKLRDINEDLRDSLIDINTDLREQLMEINRDYKKDVADANQELIDDIADIEKELAEALDKASSDSYEKREETIRSSQKKRRDLEEDHQKKLAQIERKYQSSRLKALIDRDARGLFEAEEERKRAREEAAEDYTDSVEDEIEATEEKIKEIEKREADARKDAIKAAEEKRRDAQEAYDRELRDLKQAKDEELREARAAAVKARAEAKKNANDQRRDAQEAHRDSLQDLAEWYQEQLLAQKEANIREKIQQLEHLSEMGELTEAHLNELRGMYSDYQNDVSNMGGSTPGGVPGGGSGAGGQSPVRGVGGGRGGNSTTTLEDVLGQFGGGGFGSGTIGSQGLRLDINSNDQLLQDILSSTVYDAQLRVIGGN
jgi:hypothetical protein